jgi:glycosidase
MTLPGAPSIYYGDEIGLAGEMDPGSRGAFPWDESLWDRDLLAFFQASTALRHAQPVLRYGALETVATDGNVHAFRRHDDRSSMVVAVNAGDDARSIDLQLPSLRGRQLIRIPPRVGRHRHDADADRRCRRLSPPRRPGPGRPRPPARLRGLGRA